MSYNLKFNKLLVRDMNDSNIDTNNKVLFTIESRVD
jgi:hypothetical protein